MRKINFNGVTLEDVVPGYKTLGIEGRECNDVDITLKDSVSDGSTFVSKRIPKKTITVRYMIKSQDILSESSVLSGILNCSKPCKLIFSDEPDKYYIAVFAGDEIKTDFMTVKEGEIKFECLSPFKYSLTQKEFTAVEDSQTGIMTANINNQGNMPAVIDFEISCSNENGFIGIASQSGVLQYGMRDEPDKEEKHYSEILMAKTVVKGKTDDADNTPCRIKPDVVIHSNGCQVSDGWIRLGNPGTGSGWHGSQRTATLAADGAGDTGAVNFTSYMKHWFLSSNVSQVGFQSVAYLDSSNKVVCGIFLMKIGSGNDGGVYRFFVNGKAVKDIAFKASKKFDKYANRVTKSADKVTFHYDGKYYSFRNAEIKETAVTKVQVTLATFGAYPVMPYNRISELDFTKFRSEWIDIENRYAPGEVLKIDGSKGALYVDDLIRVGDEVTGSTYFKAPAGLSKVEFYRSSWASGDFNCKAKIREAWL